MPPQVADWPQVKATAISTGSLKLAAEAHGITPEAVRQRARREKWPVGRRVQQQAQEAKELADTQLVAAATAAKSIVTRVTSASEAAENIMETHSKDTRMSLAIAAKRLAEQAEVAPLDQAGDVLKVAKTAALVHSWAGQQTSLRISMFAPGQAIDVAAEFVPDSQE